MERLPSIQVFINGARVKGGGIHDGNDVDRLEAKFTEHSDSHLTSGVNS